MKFIQRQTKNLYEKLERDVSYTIAIHSIDIHIRLKLNVSYRHRFQMSQQKKIVGKTNPIDKANMHVNAAAHPAESRTSSKVTASLNRLSKQRYAWNRLIENHRKLMGKRMQVFFFFVFFLLDRNNNEWKTKTLTNNKKWQIFGHDTIAPKHLHFIWFLHWRCPFVRINTSECFEST